MLVHGTIITITTQPDRCEGTTEQERTLAKPRPYIYKYISMTTNHKEAIYRLCTQALAMVSAPLPPDLFRKQQSHSIC